MQELAYGMEHTRGEDQLDNRTPDIDVFKSKIGATREVLRRLLEQGEVGKDLEDGFNLTIESLDMVEDSLSDWESEESSMSLVHHRRVAARRMARKAFPVKRGLAGAYDHQDLPRRLKEAFGKDHHKFSDEIKFHEAVSKGDYAYAERKIEALVKHLDDKDPDLGSRNLQQESFDEIKMRRCRELLECVAEMTSYDLFIHLFADDIDFDEGVMDTEIDSGVINGNEGWWVRDEPLSNSFLLHRIRVGYLVGELREFLEDVDLGYKELAKNDMCDVMLEQFKHTIELDSAVESVWLGSSVVDVCRSRGNSKYVSFNSLLGRTPNGTLIEEREAHTRFTDESQAFFSDLVSCSQILYDHRPPEWQNEKFVFTTRASEGYLNYRIPKGLTDDARSDNNRIKLSKLNDMDKLFKYVQSGKQASMQEPNSPNFCTHTFLVR